MSDITSLVSYYANLLIVQYHNKPKAVATITALVTELLAAGVIFDVQNGYSIETAIGKQLDIIGKYVGVDRFFKDLDLHDYFAFNFYDEGAIPDDKWGFNTYTDFDTLIENGTLTYNTIITKDFSLFDEEFRTIIKLKIIQNNSNHSHQSIDESIYKFFGNDVRPDSEGGMHMIYFVPTNLTAIIQAAIIKEVLPRPMGVGVLVVSQTNEFFGLLPYGADINPFNTGFTDYANYETKEGEILKYDLLDAN